MRKETLYYIVGEKLVGYFDKWDNLIYTEWEKVEVMI